MNSPPLRAWVHVAMLGFVFLTPLLGKWGMAAVAAAALGLNALVLPRTPLGRALRRPGEGRWSGLLSYPLAVALCYALFPPHAAAGAWAVLALGDPAAAWAGRRAGPGAMKVPWNGAKTVAGSATFLAAAWSGTVIVLLAALPAPFGLPRGQVLSDPEGLAILLGCVLAAAVAGAVAESLDLPVDDNLPVALAAGGTLALLLG